MKRLHKRGNDLDDDIRKSQQHNDNLRVKVETIERKLHATDKELSLKINKIKAKSIEVSDLESKFQDLSNYLDVFGELKKHLVILSHEYVDTKQATSNKTINKTKYGGSSLKERQSDVLKKKIKSKKEIIERNRILHQTKVRKLKRDQIILEAVSSSWPQIFYKNYENIEILSGAISYSISVLIVIFFFY